MHGRCPWTRSPGRHPPLRRPRDDRRLSQALYPGVRGFVLTPSFLTTLSPCVSTHVALGGADSGQETAGVWTGWLGLVTSRFLEGGVRRQWLEGDRVWGWEETARLGRQVCQVATRHPGGNRGAQGADLEGRPPQPVPLWHPLCSWLCLSLPSHHPSVFAGTPPASVPCFGSLCHVLGLRWPGEHPLHGRLGLNAPYVSDLLSGTRIRKCFSASEVVLATFDSRWLSGSWSRWGASILTQEPSRKVTDLRFLLFRWDPVRHPSQSLLS